MGRAGPQGSLRGRENRDAEPGGAHRNQFDVALLPVALLPRPGQHARKPVFVDGPRRDQPPLGRELQRHGLQREGIVVGRPCPPADRYRRIGHQSVIPRRSRVYFIGGPFLHVGTGLPLRIADGRRAAVDTTVLLVDLQRERQRTVIDRHAVLVDLPRAL